MFFHLSAPCWLSLAQYLLPCHSLSPSPFPHPEHPASCSLPPPLAPHIYTKEGFATFSARLQRFTELSTQICAFSTTNHVSKQENCSINIVFIFTCFQTFSQWLCFLNGYGACGLPNQSIKILLQWNSTMSWNLDIGLTKDILHDTRNVSSTSYISDDTLLPYITSELYQGHRCCLITFYTRQALHSNI